MEKTFVSMCQDGEAEPADWRKWLDMREDKSVPEKDSLGLLDQEYDDLTKNLRSMEFYVTKKKSVRFITKLWPGCYVRYLFEVNPGQPNWEFGWVDAVDAKQVFCKIQCDDNFNGMRAVTVRIIDVMQVLPYKERPLVYYKTMMCGNCNQCDRSANEKPPQSCPYSNFFNALLAKQIGDQKFISLYLGVHECRDDERQECRNCGNCENS